MNKLLGTMLVVGSIMLMIGRRAVGRKRYKYKKMLWDDWSSLRGFTPGSHEHLLASGVDLFDRGHTRKWDGIHEGRIAHNSGCAHATVGETSYVTGSGKTKQTHHLYFVCIKLPAEIVDMFPATRCTRFLDGIARDMNEDTGNMSEIRLESSTVDDSCKIEVCGDPKSPTWRELFDPIMIDALRSQYDIQWNQLGRFMVFASHASTWEKILGAKWIKSVPVEKIDTLCAGAAFVYFRMLQAAKGDISTDILDAAANH